MPSFILAAELMSDSKTIVTRGVKDRKIQERSYTFTHVFDGTCSQESLFNASLASHVRSVVKNGVSCTILAYGPTGTGKTFTMQGKKQEDGSLHFNGPHAGMIMRALELLFELIAEEDGDFEVTVSFMEIHMEVRVGRAVSISIARGAPLCRCVVDVLTGFHLMSSLMSFRCVVFRAETQGPALR